MLLIWSQFWGFKKSYVLQRVKQWHSEFHRFDNIVFITDADATHMISVGLLSHSESVFLKRNFKISSDTIT